MPASAPVGAIYATVMTTALNLLSHGTQDLYPSVFLTKRHGCSGSTVSTVVVVYNIGAIRGRLFFGTISQFVG